MKKRTPFIDPMDFVPVINAFLDSILKTKNKMKTLQITDDNAKKFYKDGPPELRIILEDSYGKEFFQPDLFDDVEEAYRRLGLNRAEELPFPGTRDKRQIVAYAKFDLDIIAEALKLSEKKIDWSDGQSKYFPVFRMHPGFGFSYSCSDYGRTSTGCGSRHSFYSEKMSDHFGKKFLHLHEIVLT